MMPGLQQNICAMKRNENRNFDVAKRSILIAPIQGGCSPYGVDADALRRVLASGRFCVVMKSCFCGQIRRDGDVRVIHADGADVDDVAFALDDVRHCEFGERGNAENRAIVG